MKSFYANSDVFACQNLQYYTDFVYDFYFASPFFNEEQVEREEALKDILRSKGYRIFSPKEADFLKPNATIEEQLRCFENNLNAIVLSKAVFAITDGKDMGTIWEAGFAYGIKKPIVYFCETLPEGGKFNLMLAQSANRVFTSREQVMGTLDLLEKQVYGGLIE